MTNIVLDLPAPLSVNRTRRVDWSASDAVAQWVKRADKMLLANRSYKGFDPPNIQRFELLITVEDGRMDLDNGLKLLIDYLRRVEVIAGDSPKHLRKITVEFGDAPTGCRLIVRPT